MDNILDRVKDVIMEQLGIEDESSITTATTFIDDLGADSLDVVELIMALEEEFDMEIPDEAVENIKTIGDIVKYIEEKLEK